MIQTAAIAFATFFATIGPIDVAAMFTAITSNSKPAHRRAMAIKGTLVATGILVAFALIGEALLAYLGISLAALRTAGGILLLLISIDMVFARSSGGVSTTADESQEAKAKADISVFPLATPLIAGPGAMGAAILLIANTQGQFVLQLMVIAAMLAVLLITFLALIGASYLQKLLGVTGLHVVTRVFGVLLAALAVQFIFDGISQSGLFTALGTTLV
ncbi:MAG: MarC family protein [Proteobacteria bacterium]|nr:MAG: MarC family protein [Pseudomonadota bacterium]TDJ70882.1 MAG: MarC family protein [Pseudomonadota bacterium]